jgi:hypothetical protein
VSFQITVLKVLAGHPGGQLSVADLTRAVALLMSHGRDWTDRTKRMLAQAPDQYEPVVLISETVLHYCLRRPTVISRARCIRGNTLRIALPQTKSVGRH